jgi:hypothetical protein
MPGKLSKSPWPLIRKLHEERFVRRGERCPTSCPIFLDMRKTSVYLDEDQARRLARLAREEGRSQAEVLREAVATYQPKPSQDRNFALAGSGRGDGSSIAEVAEEDLLRGFGE